MPNALGSSQNQEACSESSDDFPHYLNQLNNSICKAELFVNKLEQFLNKQSHNTNFDVQLRYKLTCVSMSKLFLRKAMCKQIKNQKNLYLL